MKAKTKKILDLIVLGMGFVFLPNIMFDFSVDQTTFNNLKNSSVYNGGIQIDALATTNTTYSGNWTWAVRQPWCYNDNGVYIIEDLTIDASTSPTGSGIYIKNSKNEYFIIRNCTVYSAGIHLFMEAGIILENTNNGTLTNNNCSNNNNYGICFYKECNNNTISGNIASDNEWSGIFLYTGKCHNNTISGNTANNNGENGIGLMYNCDYNNITGNTANDNAYLGILLYETQNNTISGNTLKNNIHCGIRFEQSIWNQITNNIIIDNQEYGISLLWLSDNNSIYNNFFLENGIHADDNGIDNKWNNTTIGNYWDNWTSPDISPNDGIVDVPYTYIGGSAGSIDYLPIAEDGVPLITINSPSSGSRFGVSAPSFDVTITDTTLISMWYTLDGGLHNYTFTENSTIDQSAWDALLEGNVIIRFYAIDVVGNVAFEEVSVIKNVPSGLVFIIIVSVVGGLAVIAGVYIFMKKRKTLH